MDMRGYVEVSLDYHTSRAPVTKTDEGYERVTFEYRTLIRQLVTKDETQDEMSVWENLCLDSWTDGEEVVRGNRRNPATDMG
jgi:hypothetical protein